MDDQPTGWFQSPDCVLRSDRSIAGPLRLGTAPGVGPKGGRVNGDSDFGMDRLEQRPVDRIGQKYPEVDSPVELVSRETRRSR
jgi:hypothetical protein